MDQEAVEMDIITHPDFETLKKYCELLRERLLRLILEKDELVNTIIPNIEAEYQLLIGYRTYEKFCLETEINKSKRTIDIIQTAINHGDPVTRTSVGKRLEMEFREWEERLKEHLKKIEAARVIEGSRLSLRESRRICELYRKLVKKLHPDVNPELYTRNRNLWGQVQEAYGRGDTGSLKALWMIARDLGQQGQEEAGVPSTMELLRQKEDGFKRGIQALKSIIVDITSGPPYILKDKLTDRSWVEDQQVNLEKEISDLSVQSSRFKILAEQMLRKYCDG